MTEVQSIAGVYLLQESESLYERCSAEFGPAIQRLAAAYEADRELRRDLVQEIHIALWRSLNSFENRCSLRTWVYRVAHNTAASHVAASKRRRMGMLTLDDVDAEAAVESAGKDHLAMERLAALVRVLRPLDKQTMLLYLEGFEASEIAEVMGVSASSVAIRIHRIKAVLQRLFHGSGTNHGR